MKSLHCSVLAALAVGGVAVAQPVLTYDARVVWGQIWGQWVERTPPTPFAAWMDNALLESGGPGAFYTHCAAYQESAISATGFGCLAPLISATARGTRPASAGETFGFSFFPSPNLRLVMRVELDGAEATITRDMAPF